MTTNELLAIYINNKFGYSGVEVKKYYWIGQNWWVSYIDLSTNEKETRIIEFVEFITFIYSMGKTND